MMTDTVIQSLISGGVSAGLLAIPLLIASHRKSKDKREEMAAQKQDWARQDEVAKRVAEAADQAARAAALLVESNTKVNGKLDAIGEQGKVIHDLVNSNMTAQIEDSMQSQIDKVIAQEALIALQRVNKIEPSPEAIGLIKAAKKKIEELRSRLNDRKKQQEAIDANKLTVTMSLK